MERKLKALQRWIKDQQLMGVDLSQLNHQEFAPSVLGDHLHITNKESVEITDAKFPKPLKDMTKWVGWWRKLLIAALQTLKGEQQALLTHVPRPRTGKPIDQQTLTRKQRICWNALHIGTPFTNDDAKVFTAFAAPPCRLSSLTPADQAQVETQCSGRLASPDQIAQQKW